MPKRRSIIPPNDLDEAFGLYADLMPAVTDVRGEDVFFDLGGYTHLQRSEVRLQYVAWIGETLQNPDEIRRDHRRDLPFREVYINTFWSSNDVDEMPYLVYVDRRIELNFWTAFVPDEWCLAKVKGGKLLWKQNG
jgi:hypothetical protein